MLSSIKMYIDTWTNGKEMYGASSVFLDFCALLAKIRGKHY